MSRTKNSQPFMRAEAAMKQKRHQEAIELFLKEPATLAQNWKAMWNLGWCYYHLGEFSEAGKYFDSADAASGDAACKWATGLVYLKEKNYKKAELILTESLQLKERFATHVTLALAYLTQGKVEDAEKVHLDGIKLGTRLSERYACYVGFLSDVGRDTEAEGMNRKVRELRAVQ